MKNIIILSSFLFLSMGLMAQSQEVLPANQASQGVKHQDQPIRRNTESKTYLLSGVDKFESQNWTGAIADLDKAVAQDPENSSSWAYRGMCKILTGDVDNGCADLLKAAELGDTKGDDIRAKMCGMQKKEVDPQSDN